jgi:hypothetical protein
MALNTYTLIPSFNIAGQFAQCVWHYQFDDASFTTTKEAAEDLQHQWDTANRSALRSILSASVSLVSYKGSCVSSPGGFEAFTPVTSSNTGTRAAGISVSGLAPVIVHYPVNLTLARGRTFLPAISENDIDSGIFTSNYVSAVATALSTMFDPVTLTGGGSATFGYFRRPDKVFVALVNSVLSKNLGTQRRRMRPV